MHGHGAFQVTENVLGRDASANVFHELNTEQVLFNRGDPNAISRAGQANKYSPVLKEAAMRLQGEKAVLEPVH